MIGTRTPNASSIKSFFCLSFLLVLTTDAVAMFDRLRKIHAAVVGMAIFAPITSFVAASINNSHCYSVCTH